MNNNALSKPRVKAILALALGFLFGPSMAVEPTISNGGAPKTFNTPFKASTVPNYGVKLGNAPDMGAQTNITTTYPTCTGGRTLSADKTSCVCPGGKTWNGTACVIPATTSTCPPGCAQCHATCSGSKLADGCFDAGGALLSLSSTPTYVDYACGWVAPTAGVLIESFCASNGILIKTVSNGPGSGFHWEYGTC